MRSRLLLVLCTAAALTACGSSSSSSTSSSSSASSSATSAPSSATGTTVTMKNVAFQPAEIHAKVGQTVRWVNADTPPHNVTYVSGPHFASSPQMNPGAKFSIKLTQPGTIHYYCTIHPFMKGTIIVAAS